MASSRALSIGRWRLLFVVALGILYVSVFVAFSTNFKAYQKAGGRDYPFGVAAVPGGGLFVQDFSYNMLYLRGIHERLVARPYLMQGQVEMFHKIIPGAATGMPHAYSPVAFVLTLLLPYVTGFQAYIVYFILTGGGILLLAYFYLLPNAAQPQQIGALAVTLPSVCTVTALAVGQSAMLTTVLIGALWILLRRRQEVTRGVCLLDIALAALFWAVCFKPSIAIVPFILLLGARAWTALALGLGLLLATWTAVASYYGGWWTGLMDYAYLLNHYNNGDLPIFIQLGSRTAKDMAGSSGVFAHDRDVLLLSIAVLVILRWMQRITLSEMFQLLLWIFVLFSPYILPSEAWILCLLIVEGTFFKSENAIAAIAKILLLGVIFNVRANIGLTDRYLFPAASILFAWTVFEIVRSKMSGPGLEGKKEVLFFSAIPFKKRG